MSNYFELGGLIATKSASEDITGDITGNVPDTLDRLGRFYRRSFRAGGTGLGAAAGGALGLGAISKILSSPALKELLYIKKPTFAQLISRASSDGNPILPIAQALSRNPQLYGLLAGGAGVGGLTGHSISSALTGRD